MVRVASGEWESCRHSILAGITKGSADKPAHIKVVGQNDEGISRLTADEADELAEVLHKLAATMRHGAQPHRRRPAGLRTVRGVSALPGLDDAHPTSEDPGCRRLIRGESKCAYA
jgi:hypothetical protein